MLQLAQNLRTGRTTLEEVPVPVVKKGCVLIKTHTSLISPGTEKMLLAFSRANILSKAIQNPDRVKFALAKIRSDGFFATATALSSKLDQLLPLGYNNAGEIMEVGGNVQGFRKGDRVASNGPHAGVVCVPVNLVARIPDNVPYEEAAFTALGAVGLQGIRLLAPAMGDTVVVIGLGLVGLLTADLLRINGCNVIGIEPDARKRQVAIDKGIAALDPAEVSIEKRVQSLTNAIGADGVMITATSKSHELISLAARISRKRGKVILVGNVGLHINRSEFYSKELSFQVSCSYGPGRYDYNYEELGADYPADLVRWTENRNFQAVLRLLSSGALNVKPLISRRVALPDFQRIYEDIENHIATIIYYPESVCDQKPVRRKGSLFPPTEIVAGVVGAGNFTRMTLLPLLKGKSIKYVASAGGLTASEISAKHKIPFATSDYQEILDDREVDLVLIATRHDLHSKMVIDGLQADKHVFVEKPLALFPEELDKIREVWEKASGTLNVGFNRRFSAHSMKMKELLGGAIMNVVVTVNAGKADQAWIYDRFAGGGRIIGEACHFIDLITFLTESRVVSVCMNALQDTTGSDVENATLMLRYANGSTGVVNYFSNGHRSYSKERVEVYSEGRTLILDDFCRLTGYGFQNFGGLRTQKDKGHCQQFNRLWETIKAGKGPLIDFEELVNTTRVTFGALESIATRSRIDISR